MSEHITCTAAYWIANADEILKQQSVRNVALTTWIMLRQGQLIEQPKGYEWSTVATWAELRNRWPGIEFNLPKRLVLA